MVYNHYMLEKEKFKEIIKSTKLTKLISMPMMSVCKRLITIYEADWLKIQWLSLRTNSLR